MRCKNILDEGSGSSADAGHDHRQGDEFAGERARHGAGVGEPAVAEPTGRR